MSKLSHSTDTSIRSADILRAIDDDGTIMKSVRSGTMKAIGYDEETQTLIVEFYSGIYVYDTVPADVHRKLMASDSKGKFFASHIRNKYDTLKLPNPALRERAAANPLAAA